jgi:peptide/nickel transport system permease protein
MKEKVKKTAKRRSQWGEFVYRLKKNKGATISVFVLAIIIIIAIFAPYIAPYTYDAQDYSASFAKPSAQHLLGCDRLGRDILSRLIYGSRQSLQLGVMATFIAAAIGMILGAIAGYYGGIVDSLIMRFFDIYQSIPMFLLCVTLASIMGPSLKNAIVAIGVATIPGPARLMRASILTIRTEEYIEAAKMSNLSNTRIIATHIIPNAIAPVLVSITMAVGMNILSGSMLSFIGLGAQPPIPEWGTMVSDARSMMRDHMMLSVYPGICIMIAVLACNLLGDGIRDAFDPRLKN